MRETFTYAALTFFWASEQRDLELVRIENREREGKWGKNCNDLDEEMEKVIDKEKKVESGKRMQEDGDGEEKFGNLGAPLSVILFLTLFPFSSPLLSL